MPLFAHRWVTNIEGVEETQKRVQQMLEELQNPLDKRKEDKLPITNDPPSASSGCYSGSCSSGAKTWKRSSAGSQQFVALESMLTEEEDLDVNGLWCNTVSEEAKRLIENESDNSDADEDIPTIFELRGA